MLIVMWMSGEKGEGQGCVKNAMCEQESSTDLVF